MKGKKIAIITDNPVFFHEMKTHLNMVNHRCHRIYSLPRLVTEEYDWSDLDAVIIDSDKFGSVKDIPDVWKDETIGGIANAVVALAIAKFPLDKQVILYKPECFMEAAAEKFFSEHDVAEDKYAVVRALH